MDDLDLIDGLRDKADDANEPDAGLLLDAAARLDRLRWRSVEDSETPPTMDPIDIYDTEDKEVIVGWYEGGEFRATHGDAYLVIVATRWRPRPAPPGAEGGGE